MGVCDGVLVMLLAWICLAICIIAGLIAFGGYAYRCDDRLSGIVALFVCCVIGMMTFVIVGVTGTSSHHMDQLKGMGYSNINVDEGQRFTAEKDGKMVECLFETEENSVTKVVCK